MTETRPEHGDPKDYPRAALVTGAARRIGRTIARALADDGWALALHFHRSSEAAEDLAKEVVASGGRAITLQANLAKEAESAKLVARAVAELGPLGCLVNNASAFSLDRIESATRESWDAHIEPNLRAPLVLSQAFAAALPAHQGGLVVNLLDQRVWNLTPHFLSYTLSKAGLWNLTRTLAMALAPRIRVNAIGPGPTLASPRQSAEQFERQWRSMPLGRGATPEDIADAVRFLLTARSMTGQMVALDGGQHLGWAQPGPSVLPEE